MQGCIYAADEPEKRIALQIVGRRTEITDLGDWGERPRRTQIVAIGSGFDGEELRKKFDACTSSQV